MAGDREPDGDRLPWLEEADGDFDARHGFGRMLGVLAAIFVGGVLVTLAVWWFVFRTGSLFGSGQLIRAPEQPYRQRPAEAGGMKVEGAGDLAYQASEGQDVNSAINLDAMPEEPVVGAGAKPAEPQLPPAATTGAAAPGRPLPAPMVLPAKPAAAPPSAAVPPAGEAAAIPTPASAPVSGGVIQLGAFSTSAKAQAAWKSLSGRFQFLGALEARVVPVASGGSTLYRLRATAGGQAADLCQRLKVAGETCSIVG